MGIDAPLRPDPGLSLDVIVPAHDEEARIGAMLSAYRAALPGPGVRFLVALDGCRDATRAVVEEHAAQDRRVRSYTYPKLGKGGVIQETARRCRTGWVAFIDADGATPPRELARLLDAASRLDGAIASRRLPTSVVHGHRAAHRAAVSRLFSFVVPRLFSVPFHDTQCGAKVIRADVLAQLLPHLTTRGLLFDLELLLVAHRLGYRIAEVPTVWIDRPGSRIHLLRHAVPTALSIVRLWWGHRIGSVRAALGPARLGDPSHAA